MKKIMRGGNGRLWMIYPTRIFMSSFGVHRILEYDGVCRIMIKGAADAKPLQLFRDPVIFEVHYGDCTDPKKFDEYIEFIRIKDCKLRRQWINRPVAIGPSEDIYIKGWFEFEGKLDHCPWLLVK